MERNAWDKREDETPRSYALFCEFLRLGPTRSLTGLHRIANNIKEIKSKPTLSSINTYSSRCNWFKRAEAYDKHILKQDMERYEEETRKFKDTRINHDKELEMELYKKIIKALSDPGLSEKEIADIIDKGTKALARIRESHRLDAGKPTTINKTDMDVKGDIDVSIHEEIEEYERMFKAIERESKSGNIQKDS